MFGEVPNEPYGNTVSVAASACDGRPRIAVASTTKEGRTISGLMGADTARNLIALLCAAVEYAERIADDQKAASIPALERKLAEARAAQSR